MAQNEYQALSDKIDRLTEKIGEQFTRIEDNKLSKGEYERAYEAIILRVNAIEQKMDSESKASDAEHLRIETASATRYDKIEAKFDALNTKFDGLKDTINTRFDNLKDTQAASRRGWLQWSVGLLVGLIGGGGAGSLIWYIAHLAHP